MIRTQQIALEGKIRHVHREHAFNDQMNVACSVLIVCPTCHRMWATLKFVDTQIAWPRAQWCEGCNQKDPWHPVPGSILIEEGWGTIDDSLLAALPPDLVAREFYLHLKAYS